MRSQILFKKFVNGKLGKVSGKPSGRLIFGLPRLTNFNETVAGTFQNLDPNI